MIIEKLTIKRLKAIRETKTIDFSPGLNIIKGSDNEVGKSSIRIAITKALFEDTASGESSPDLTSWGANEPWEVSLDFENSTGSYRITRSLKDKTGELIGTGSYEFAARNKNSIAEKIAELTGCPSEAFFVSTACIGQDELIRIIPGNTAVSDAQETMGMISKRLQSKLSGAERGIDIPALITKLYSQANNREASGPHNQLVEVKERIFHLRDRELEESKKVEDILDKRRSLYKIREEMESISRELPPKIKQIEENRKILALQKEISKDRAQYDSYKKALEYRAKLAALDEELAMLSPFIEAEEKVKQMETIRNYSALLSRQISDIEHDAGQLEKQRPSLGILVTGIILMVAGITCGIVVNPYWWSLAVLGLLMTSYWIAVRRTWNKQIELVKRRMNELTKALANNQDEQLQLLRFFNCKDHEEYLRCLVNYATLIQSKKDVTSKIEVLLNSRKWEDFVKDNIEIANRMDAQLQELETLVFAELKPLDLKTLEAEVKNLHIKMAKLEQEKGGLEQFFMYAGVDKGSLIDIEEELVWLEKEKEALEAKRNIYRLTHDVLESAYKQTLLKASDLLEKEISRYIDMITDGKYSQVKISDIDMSLSTFSQEKGDWVDVVQLSRGTQDQFYICARLALVRLITEGKKPPILLDDPFVHFHTKRLRKMISLLQEIAKEYQIILFTCSDAYDYLGAVVSID